MRNGCSGLCLERALCESEDVGPLWNQDAVTMVFQDIVSRPMVRRAGGDRPVSAQCSR